MRSILIILVIVVCNCAIADDLQLPRDQIQAGQDIFRMKCAQCHGMDAAGGNAPDIQGVILQDVWEAIQGVEAMPEIVLREDEARQVAIYLMSLAPDQARIRLGIN